MISEGLALWLWYCLFLPLCILCYSHLFFIVQIFLECAFHVCNCFCESVFNLNCVLQEALLYYSFISFVGVCKNMLLQAQRSSSLYVISYIFVRMVLLLAIWCEKPPKLGVIHNYELVLNLCCFFQYMMLIFYCSNKEYFSIIDCEWNVSFKVENAMRWIAASSDTSRWVSRLFFPHGLYLGWIHHYAVIIEALIKIKCNFQR